MITLFIIVCVLVYYYCTRTLSHWRNKNVTGPKPMPLFGNILESVLRKKHLGIVFKDIYDAYPNEKVIGFFRMTAPTLIIRDLDIVKNILIKDFDAFPTRGIQFSKEALGDNLFHCDSDTWRFLRKKFTPVFTSGKLKNLFNVLNEHGDQFVEYLEDITLKKCEQEVYQHFQKYTMSTIIASAFGLNVDLYNSDRGFIEKAGHYAFKSTYAAEMDLLFPNIWKITNMSLYNHDVNQFSYEMLKMAVKHKNDMTSDRNDAIDMMLALRLKGKIDPALKQHEDVNDVSLKITDHIMAAQVFIIFIAGFGNNALTLSYALFHLAKHPEIQEKLLKDIREIFARYNGKLTYDTVREITYLDQVFAETLRLNPLTNSVQRSAEMNYKIPGMDVVIEKGTTVIISPYAIHRDRENFPDPSKFDPERFSLESSRDRHSCAYIPFGAGPRSCIGRQLAKLQFAVAIIKVLLKYEIKLSSKTEKIEDYDPMRTLIATKGGIYVNFVPRKA